MSNVLLARNLAKSYSDGDRRLDVLTDVSFELEAGERIAVIGRSGSGKSTLLHILAGLTDADSGEVSVSSNSVTSASPAERARIRNQYMGFVYQFHHLLPEFTALENVAMPLLSRSERGDDVFKTAAELLNAVGLAERQDHFPHQLSGGERQRVAVSRALVNQPKLVIADEPTGNLDAENAEDVLSLMVNLSESLSTSLLIATHDQSVVARMNRTLRLSSGVVHDETI